MVERNHLQMSVKRQAELLGVNRASIYCKPSDQEDKDIELMHLIDEIYTRWPHYGYRRIRVVLRDRGCVVNKKRVLRLMRRMGIAGLCPGPNLSKDYIELLKQSGVQISMDGKGRATDNAITERFFRNLKWEKIYYEEYRVPREVYRAVRTYIDEYNYERPHQAINYRKPQTCIMARTSLENQP